MNINALDLILKSDKNKVPEGEIYGINGPVVTILGNPGFKMNEMVYVGDLRLVGEVIGLNSEKTTIEVYEETSGMKPGEKVVGSGSPVSCVLAPGIISNIFDGIERPLNLIREKEGAYISKGVSVDSLPQDKLWETHITVKPGDRVSGGSIIAEVKETRAIVHKVMLPPGTEGTVKEICPDGSYTINDKLITVELSTGEIKDMTMCQRWPIRIPRPVSRRYSPTMPLITGQRIIGERGNEMTQVLEEFTELVDPKTGNPLMDRTVLIANTSNMPVAAREASLYSGLTLAEYYRDMGYHVAIMADSTSRWAEALRELSGRLEEMPAEEGYPAYLASRLAMFYERAGFVKNLNGTEGSVSIIGAVSPQGGDFSEPVTQNTKRFVRCFWALDKSLAYARHYPAIQWLTSYSEYTKDLSAWYSENVDKRFMDYRNQIYYILTQESKLMDIVKLIGSDVLPDDQKLTLLIAKVIRIGFLQQNAFHKEDTCVPMEKQFKMMELILYLNKKCKALIALGMPVSVLERYDIFDRIINIKYDMPNDKLEMFEEYTAAVDRFYDDVLEKNG